jgi:hypothetical protein
VKHNQCRPVSTLRLHLQLGKRGPHSGPAAGALRAISAGRGATRQLLCSVCTAGAHRRAAPQRGSASGSSSTLLGQVRRGRVRHSAPSQRPVCAVCGVTRRVRHGRCSSASAAKCGPWTQTVTSSRHSQCGHSESHSSSGSPAAHGGCRAARPPCGSRGRRCQGGHA